MAVPRDRRAREGRGLMSDDRFTVDGALKLARDEDHSDRDGEGKHDVVPEFFARIVERARPR
jgi:hypothetical protein